MNKKNNLEMKNFKKHKEIRKKLKSAIKKGTLGLIDIGSSKIVCIIIKFSEINKNPKNFRSDRRK